MKKLTLLIALFVFFTTTMVKAQIIDSEQLDSTTTASTTVDSTMINGWDGYEKISNLDAKEIRKYFREQSPSGTPTYTDLLYAYQLGLYDGHKQFVSMPKYAPNKGVLKGLDTMANSVDIALTVHGQTLGAMVNYLANGDSAFAILVDSTTTLPTVDTTISVTAATVQQPEVAIQTTPPVLQTESPYERAMREIRERIVARNVAVTKKQ